MTRETAVSHAGVGRRRSDKAREAILQATNELLEELGYEKLTIEGIAARAGVGKTTIYRWWNGKGPLALEAFLQALTPQIAFPQAGPAIESLRAQIPLVAKAYRGKTGKVLREIIALGQSDEETRRLFVEGYLEPRRTAAKAVLLQGIEQGELREDLDLDVAVDALYGPIFHRMLSGHAPLNDQFVDRLIDAVIEGISSGNKRDAHAAGRPTRQRTRRASAKTQS